MYLQSYITPVVAYSQSGGQAHIERAFGTSFVIDGFDGQSGNALSMTAAHVLKAAICYTDDTGCRVGIVGKGENGLENSSIAVPVQAAEGAPGGSDIAIMISEYHPRSLLGLTGDTPSVWEDVATLGYPGEAIVGEPKSLRLNLRAQKGYVQRLINPGELLHRPTLVGYELSFLLAGGMSGAPVFVHRGDKDMVIGVSVGTFGSETMISEKVEVLRDGSTYKEIQNSLNRYGVAESVAPVLDWRPEILLGITLRDYLGGNMERDERPSGLDTRLPFINL